MPLKVTMIGAGSIGFTRKLLQDILTVPELQDTRFAFTDINEKNLDFITRLARRDIEHNGVPASVEATTDRRRALEGADYVFSLVRVGGLEAFRDDIRIPLGYGVDQCVGDTLCAGGIMYGQRGIPASLDFCRDIREVAGADCLFMNYANPMAMITWACNKYGGVRTVGLCHGVYHTAYQIADALGVPFAELEYACAGINHQTWFIVLRHRVEDITPGRLAEAFENHPVYSRTEKVRIDILKRFGLFSTESNGHLSEYLPWYRKRRDTIADWVHLGDWINGESGGYLRHCLETRNWADTDFPRWIQEEPPRYAPESRSPEHGSHIIEAMETGRVYRGHFNVVNRGVIPNLPHDCVVEAPGYVDRYGIHTPVVGDLPLACAATCNVTVSVQRMAVEAAVHGDVGLLKQAMMHDPLCGACCTTEEIWQMTDAMLVAQREWLPQYRDEIARIEERLQGEPSLARHDHGLAVSEAPDAYQ